MKIFLDTAGFLWYNRRAPSCCDIICRIGCKKFLTFFLFARIILFVGREWFRSKLEKIMPYTKNEEFAIRAAAPLNKEVAAKLASDFGKTTRSVISKAISMKVEYHKEEKATAQAKVRKAEVVRQIESALGVECNSLVNANAKDLATLLDAVS